MSAYRYTGEHRTATEAMDAAARMGLVDVRLMRGETGLVRGVGRIATTVTRVHRCPACAERARHRSDLGVALACFGIAALALLVLMLANDGTAAEVFEGWVVP